MVVALSRDRAGEPMKEKFMMTNDCGLSFLGMHTLHTHAEQRMHADPY